MQPSFQNHPPPPPSIQSSSSSSFSQPTSQPYIPPHNNPYSLPPYFQTNHPQLMTQPVPFAALSDPIKLFDGLDVTYPPEKFLAQLSARVTFQLGPQPNDPFAYSTWHHCRMSLLYCSLTGTASSWNDRLPQS